MIGTIRKHSKWLWIVIIVVTVFTFVYWGSNPSSRDPRSGGGYYGAIDGQRISALEIGQAEREVRLRHWTMYGTFPDRNSDSTGFNLERETYYWLFFTRKLQEFDIQVDSASVAQAANQILRGFSEGRQVTMDDFVKFLGRAGIGEDDFGRYLRHDLGLQQLIAMVGLSGRLVTPAEGRAFYQRQYQQVATEAVFFSASNHLADVAVPAPDVLARYYAERTNTYEIPERVQVSYVAFSISNHLGQAAKELTNLTEQVEVAMQRLGTNVVRFGKTPEEARAKIREEMLHERAAFHARNEADTFANELLSLDPITAANLAALARTNGLAVGVTAPFEQATGPSEFDGGPNFAGAAFLLSPDRPIADQSLIGESAVYVIALDKRLPSVLPPLSEVRDRVVADYRQGEAATLARRAGEAFVRAATNGLAHGKTFAAVCAEAKVKPETIPPFSLDTRELPGVEGRASVGLIKQLAFGTVPGRLSEFAPTRDGGVAVHVRERLPIDPAKMEAEMPAFMNLLRRTRGQEAMNDWFAREASKSLRETRLGQSQSQGQVPGQPVGQATP